MQQSIVKFYYSVVETLLNMFRATLCPSSGARQTAVAASGFRTNVEVDVISAVVDLLVGRQCVLAQPTHTVGRKEGRKETVYRLCLLFSACKVV
jgi:hypothetical protein